MVQLDWLADRYPEQLSAAASASASPWPAPWQSKPKVLLLDEPFGALDAKVRKELRRWLRRLHDEVHVTSVFVTHDQEEAMEVADRIVVMNEGRIEQDGPPDEVYDRPASPFVLQFLGDVNLFHARLDHQPGHTHADPTNVSYVRPHELAVVSAPEPGTIEATLSHLLTVGPNTRLEFKRSDDGRYIDVELPRAEFQMLKEKGVVRPGAKAWLKPQRVRRFIRQGDDFVESQTDPAAMI